MQHNIDVKNYSLGSLKSTKSIQALKNSSRADVIDKQVSRFTRMTSLQKKVYVQYITLLEVKQV